MQLSEEALKAKKDKRLKSFLVIDRPGEGKFIRLCLDVEIEYTGKQETVFIECPAEIGVQNYTGGKKEITSICFHTYCYHYSGMNYINTFLKAIKKDSNVTFQVVAFNSSDWMKENNIVNHKLVGCIGEDSYLLAEYFGADNSASPIKWIPANEKQLITI